MDFATVPALKKLLRKECLNIQMKRISNGLIGEKLSCESASDSGLPSRDWANQIPVNSRNEAA